MGTGILAVLCLLCLYCSLVITENQQPPRFCRSYQCPKYYLEKKYKGLEQRVYEQTHWVATDLDLKLDYSSVITSYNRLSQYISGSNEQGERLEMAVPVVVIVPINRHSPANATMLFFLPPHTDRPIPLDSRIFLVKYPVASLYVKSFAGFALASDYVDKSKALAEELVVLEKPFDTSFFACSGYDGPHKLTDRHNEVWFLAI
ncbi:heme-binding protein 2-like [Pelodytes ibericus]